MIIIIPASGRTDENRFWKDAPPKCLLELKDGKTILDVQMDVLKKYNIPVFLVVGYKKQEVMEYCMDKYYTDINIVDDHTWNKEYSLTRMVRDNSYMFMDEFIMIFSDLIFRDDLMNYIRMSTEDVYNCHNVRKFSTRGAQTLVKAVQQNYQIKNLDAPIFRKMQELDPELTIKYRENKPVWQFDVDNKIELNMARKLSI